VKTILNPAPAGALSDELLRLCDLCIPNETEAETLTGRSAGSLDGAEAAARDLVGRQAGAAIVTLGDRGTVLVDRDGTVHVPALRVQAVDPTGAGDAFVAALAVFWAEGQPLRSAMQQAAAVAALAVTRPGAQASFPRRAEVAAFLDRSKGE
jgi:ribokinase